VTPDEIKDGVSRLAGVYRSARGGARQRRAVFSHKDPDDRP
jgi:hypothetical protein